MKIYMIMRCNVFGYVRAFKPQMRICEYDTYKSVYCGLCKQMGKEFGFISRFTLSYDFTFLAIMNMSLGDYCITHKSERCIAHPLKKSMCLKSHDALEYPSYAAIILIYHKLRDDYADRGIKGRVAAFFTLPFLKKGYKKASAKYPELAIAIEMQMKDQKILEQSQEISIDKACHPSAVMMEETAKLMSDNPDEKRVLGRFGYFLGRYVYLCDALDDLYDDYEKKNYNPVLLKFGFKKDKNGLSDEQYEQAAKYVNESINLTLAEIANSYVLLDQKRFQEINNNIIYIGLKNTFSLIYNRKFNKKEKRTKTRDERIV